MKVHLPARFSPQLSGSTCCRALPDGPPLLPETLQPSGLGCSSLYNPTILATCSVLVPSGLLRAAPNFLPFPPLPHRTAQSGHVHASSTLPFIYNKPSPLPYLGAVMFPFLSFLFLLFSSNWCRNLGPAMTFPFYLFSFIYKMFSRNVKYTLAHRGQEAPAGTIVSVGEMCTLPSRGLWR